MNNYFMVEQPPVLNPFIDRVFTQFINKDIKTIFELGCYDGNNSVGLLDFYKPNKIYSFEASPHNYEICKNKLSGYNNIELYNYAITNKNEKVSFFLHPNGGSSSIYKHPIDFTMEIQVQSITLDTFCNEHDVKNIDLICSDIEGAERVAFNNQQIMNTVQYIITEVKLNPNWPLNFPMIEDFNKIFEIYGLHCVCVWKECQSIGNVLFSKI